MYNKEQRHQLYLLNKEKSIEYGKKYYQKNRDKILLWFKNNRDKVNKYKRDKRIRWRLANPNEKYPFSSKPSKNQFGISIYKKYGITLEQYNEMLEKQNSLCAICVKAETKKNKYGFISRLHTDHCHKTKVVRGLLCNKCNNGLGYFDDNTDYLLSAIKYLTR